MTPRYTNNMFGVFFCFPRTTLLFLSACLAVGVFAAAPLPQLVDVRNSPGNDTTAPVWSGLTAGQTFIPLRDNLTSMRLETGSVSRLETRIEFRIRRVHAAEDLLVLRGPIRQFQTSDAQGLVFTFSPLKDVRGETLFFSLGAPTTAKTHALPIRFEIAGDRYPAGERFENARARPGDLGFTMWARAGRIESWNLRFVEGAAGVWAAAIVLLVLSGLLLFDALPVWRGTPLRPVARFRIALLASIAVALLYTLPVYARLGFWAADEGDWPELVSHLSAARQTLALGEFPGWNPYMCGGTPGFANPQTYFLSPMLLAAVIGGEVVGPKVAFTLVISLGLFGAFLLTETLRLRGLSAFLPGIVFLLSGFTTTHLANGQFLWLTIAWVPWVVMGYLRSLDGSRWWTLLASGFLSLIFLEGRVYLVAYVSLYLLLLGLLLSVQQRRLRPLQNLLLVGILFIFGSAWKLFPTLAFLADREMSLPNTDGIPWSGLDEAFLRRDVTPSGIDDFGDIHIPRHEYAAYVGILPLLLAALSAHRTVRRIAIPICIAGGIFLFLATQTATTSLLEYVPLLRELRNPSRMLSMVTLSIAMLSGIGLQALPRFLEALRIPQRLRRLVPLGVVGIVLVNLVSVAWPNFMHLFSFSPKPQAFTARGFFQTNVPNFQAANGYPAVAAGKGARDFCPAVLHAYRPVHHVRAREDRDYRGEVYAEGQAHVRLLGWMPNSVRIAVDANTEDTVVVNQQFDRGWSAAPFSVKNHGTLLAVSVPAGRHVVHFRYRPPWLIAGSMISLSTVIGLGALWRRQRTARRTAGSCLISCHKNPC